METTKHLSIAGQLREYREARRVVAVANGSKEPPPVSEMSDEDIVILYQQISGRVSMYNTDVLIARMFELRAELLRRLAARSNKVENPSCKP